MSEARLNDASGLMSARAYLLVTRTPEGSYCVVYTSNKINRQSYTPSLEQVIHQAQLAGNIPIRTDDQALRQRCQELDVPLI